MNKVRPKIEALLKSKPHLRDDDRRLIASVWYREANVRMTHLSAEEFLHKYADKKLTSAETIRRTRQKIQEEIPELRGNTYHKRQTKDQERTLEELGYRQPFKT